MVMDDDNKSNMYSNNYYKSIAKCITRNVIDFHAYHCICHTGFMHLSCFRLEAEKRYYPCSSCCGKGVSFWFDSSQDRYASGSS